MTALELPNGVSGIGRDQSDQEDGQDSTEFVSTLDYCSRGMSYGTSPNVARAFGSARIPKEIVSAIITDRVSPGTLGEKRRLTHSSLPV
jgi:hypothetical protein